MMKKFALIFLIVVAFANCKTVENRQISNSNLQRESDLTKAETTPNEKPLLENLTKEQKKWLGESLPPKVRKILDNAEEIEVYVDFNKDTKGLKVLSFNTIPNTVAKLSDFSLKKQFLESFYYDASLGYGGAGCWSPRHRIKVKYNNESVEFDICYQCSNFKGNGSNGRFFGSLGEESKSLPIMNEIIEKYGTAIQ